uniref:RGS domain-containing protein n=1 Tax=Acanthochromis polyacanthus TaxID=80966 RepID=A0A3Q1GZ09_9TELE
MPRDTSTTDDLVHNLVANTACLKAQQIDRNKLRNERVSLTLPRPEKSSVLRAAVGKKYESLCEQQPIGRKLFQQFLLASDPQCVAAAEFLEELNAWRFAENETIQMAKQRVLAKFFRPESTFFLSYLTGKYAKMCKDLTEKNLDEPLSQEESSASPWMPVRIYMVILGVTQSTEEQVAQDTIKGSSDKVKRYKTNQVY